ncbi:hypothetical protein AWRI3578_g551 [Hanseniaspora opuntiae]|jgi:hypothetical protein|uniref:Essential protein Yae1 N-terminal domain-containing protein n=1 Tax=Hanseniaspora opuntiae TaxID=211096 RepID=A0A1E5RXE3_9ASCO|nr:hypothetical protein AWRI3578_g551 [Hanseniaspora opuntiae]
MNDDLFDEMLLLSPEQVSYNKGYEEGLSISKRRNVQEGREYGVMMGYQSFLIVGQVQSIVEGLLSTESLLNGGMRRSCEEILTLLSQIKPCDNEDEKVQGNMDIMHKVKNKLKLIMIMLTKYEKSSLTYEQIERVYNQVGNGLIPSKMQEEKVSIEAEW